VDAEEYRGKMDNVFMATRSKMPWFHKDSGKPEAGRVLYIQQDGARVHTTDGNLEHFKAEVSIAPASSSHHAHPTRPSYNSNTDKEPLHRGLPPKPQQSQKVTKLRANTPYTSLLV